MFPPVEERVPERLSICGFGLREFALAIVLALFGLLAVLHELQDPVQRLLVGAVSLGE
jgi:hypothetical protein